MAALFFSVAILTCLIAAISGEFQLTIMHTNDMHSRIDEINRFNSPCVKQETDAKKCFGGVARLRTKIKEIRQQFPDSSLLMDVGDMFQGTVWSSHYEGLDSSYFMNQLGYDVMTLGNHEFDYGQDTLKAFIDNVTFPIVGCNIDFGETVLKDAVFPSHVFTIKNRKVGVIGLMTTRLSSIQSAARLKGLTVSDETPAIRAEAAKLKAQGVDIIIGLSQTNYFKDQETVMEVEDIDVIVGGRTSILLYNGDPPSGERVWGEYPTVVERPSGSKALVVTAYAFTKYLGNLTVTFTDDGKVSSWEGLPILLDSSVEEDPTLKATVDQWKGPIDELRNKILGFSYVFMDAGISDNTKICRSRECNFGNIVTDAVLWTYLKSRDPSKTDWSDVSIALWNGGGIRLDLNQGPLTLAKILVTLPYRNTVSAANITGEILLEMLENSVSRIGNLTGTGRFLQIAGMRVTYNLEKPVGERVVSVVIRCTTCLVPKYEPLEKTKTYKILLNSYMALGGDGYTMIPTENIFDIGTTEGECVKNLVETFTPLTTGMEGRIKFVTEETTEKFTPSKPSPTCPPKI